MNSLDISRTLADYYLWASALLAATLLAFLVVRQPARRMAIAWATAGGLLVLLVLTAVPNEARYSLASPAPPIAPLVERSESIAIPAAAPALNELRSDSPPTVLQLNLPAPVVMEIDWKLITLLVLGLGSLAVACWLALGSWQARRLRGKALAAPSGVVEIFSQLTRGRRREIELGVHRDLPVAVALGLQRPCILLPQTLVDEASAGQLRSVLAHELAHVEHRDLWLLALLRVLSLLLWPHPLFWLLRRQVRHDQEVLADTAAAELTSRVDYAEQLVALARSAVGVRMPRLASSVGLWEGRSQLAERIKLLLDERLTILRNCSRGWRLGSAGMFFALVLGLSLVTLSPNLESNAEAVEPSNVATSKIDPLNKVKKLVLDKIERELSSIESLYVEYTTTHSSSPTQPASHVWARTGNKLYWAERRPLEQQTISERYDGTEFYSVQEIKGLVTPARITETDKGDIMRYHLTPEHCMGLHVANLRRGDNLLDILKDPGLEFDEKTNAISVESWAKDLPGSHLSGPLRMRAILDSARDYLPREIEFSLAGRPDSEYMQHWQVLEFTQVTDGRTGHVRWFPRKAVLTQGIPNEVTIETNFVAINQAIPDSLFTPESASPEAVPAAETGNGATTQSASEPATRDSSKLDPRKSLDSLHSSLEPNTVTGVCVEENNEPISGVEVELYEQLVRERTGEPQKLRSTTTNAEGRFTFENVVDIPKEFPDGFKNEDEVFAQKNTKILAVLARKQGRVMRLSNDTASRIAQFGAVILMPMPPSQTLHGVVADEMGNPVVEAEVAFGPSAAGFPSAFTTVKTDNKGRFVLTNMEGYSAAEAQAAYEREHGKSRKDPRFPNWWLPWQRQLTISHPKFATKRVAIDKIPGRMEVTLEVGTVLTGRILTQEHGESPEPAGSVELNVRYLMSDPRTDEDPRPATLHITTNSDGEYRTEAIEAGPVTLSANAAGWFGKPLEFVADADTVNQAPELILTRGGQIRLQLVDDETDRPLKFDAPTKAFVNPQPLPRGSEIDTVVEFSRDGVGEQQLPAGKYHFLVSIPDMNSQTELRDKLFSTIRDIDTLDQHPSHEVVEGEVSDIEVRMVRREKPAQATATLVPIEN